MKLRTLLLDLGGVFYQGDHLIPGALEALARLRASGLTLRFVTNTTRQTRTAIAAQLAAPPCRANWPVAASPLPRMNSSRRPPPPGTRCLHAACARCC